MALILLIDDEDLVRAGLRRPLEQAGHTVIEARDGAEGLRRFYEWQPDVVVTDIIMPNVEGIEVILTLRREAPQVKIIAISGGGLKRTPLFLEFASEFGANEVLQKPFPPSALVATVSRLTGVAPFCAEGLGVP